jgi:catechol 2,3-dioxygenase
MTEQTQTVHETGDPGYGVAPPGFRLPATLRLGAVRLQVSDLERSLVWYRDLLGLRVLALEGGTARLGTHGEDVTLVELVERPGVRAVPRRGLIGLYHFALLLPSRAALGAFLAHLASRGERPGMADHRVSEALYLTDPDGLGIEVYADRPRAEWRHQNRQLEMATDPLAVQSLLREGENQPWNGMPAGTVIGHVHLYVDDIAAAEAYYHHGLGMDKVVWNYPGALFLSAGGYHHHLGTNTWAAGSPRATEQDARLLEWTLHVPSAEDAAAGAASLRAAGFSADEDARGVRSVDPWGTPLRLVGGAQPA